MPLTAFPDMRQQIEKLVNEHRQLKGEPLLLAILYEPQRDAGDLFLFEVIEGFGGGQIDEDQELFEVTYASTPSFAMSPGQKLHLVLTSPEEFDVACRENWRLLQEVREAVRNGNATTIYTDPQRHDLEAQLNG